MWNHVFTTMKQPEIMTVCKGPSEYLRHENKLSGGDHASCRWTASFGPVVLYIIHVSCIFMNCWRRTDSEIFSQNCSVRPPHQLYTAVSFILQCSHPIYRPLSILPLKIQTGLIKRTPKANLRHRSDASTNICCLFSLPQNWNSKGFLNNDFFHCSVPCRPTDI